MDGVADRLREVLRKIDAADAAAGHQVGHTRLVAVTKTFGADDIQPAIAAGQRVFGENRVQEAQGKWPELKSEWPDIDLHLIGPLQSNKTKDAVALFDVIETIDRDKIARAIAAEIRAQRRKPRLYVQVNTGAEPQKAGVDPRLAADFVERCRSVHGLDIEGLMCIPPFDENPGPHFALLAKLGEAAGVGDLSMGMSADYETAIAFGATSVRVGSAIFGERG